MGLYRRGKIFWFNISQDGKRIQVSTKTNNKKLAEKIYAKALTEIQEGKWFEGVKARSMTVSQLLERYCKERENSKAKNTILRDMTLKKHINGYFGKCTLAGVTPETCNEYRQYRYAQKKTPATVNRELALFRNAFNVAISVYKWCKSNPVSETKFDKENNKRDRWLTLEEEQRLLTGTKGYLNGQLSEISVLALNTGMREGEILALKWQDIDFFRKVIAVHETKNKEPKTIPLNKTAHEILLKKSKLVNISGYVFATQKGTQIRARNLQREFTNSLKKAGITNFRFHDLRHTFATRLVQSGVDLYSVAKLLGHKDITITQRYAHHYPESLRSSVEILDKCYNSATIR